MQGKSVLLRISGELELMRVRVIGVQLYFNDSWKQSVVSFRV